MAPKEDQMKNKIQQSKIWMRITKIPTYFLTTYINCTIEANCGPKFIRYLKKKLLQNLNLGMMMSTSMIRNLGMLNQSHIKLLEG